MNKLEGVSLARTTAGLAAVTAMIGVLAVAHESSASTRPPAPAHGSGPGGSGAPGGPGGPRGGGQHARLPFSARVVLGTQTYACVDGKPVTPSTPEARLERGIHHFAGPTWQAPDGSLVKATVTSSTPRPGTIAELVLTVTLHQGVGLLSGVNTITRTETSGGAPPATCTGSVSVPYHATYTFKA